MGEQTKLKSNFYYSPDEVAFFCTFGVSVAMFEHLAPGQILSAAIEYAFVHKAGSETDRDRLRDIAIRNSHGQVWRF